MSDENGGTQRVIGEQGGRLRALEDRTERIENKLDVLAETMAQAKGGWKTLLLVGGAAGAMGAFIGKFLPFFAGK